MAIVLVAEQFIEKAEQGEKLSTEERRHAVAYLTARGDKSNMDMSKLFGVDEKTIRMDVLRVKQEAAIEMKSGTDIKLIVGDIVAARDRAVTNLLRVMRQMEQGGKEMTPLYVQLNKEVVTLHLKVTESLQNMGVVPKAVTATEHRHVFKAFVQKGGAIDTRRIEDDTDVENLPRDMNMFKGIRDGESLEEKVKREAEQQKRAIRDAEFEMVDVPQLPDVTGDGESAPE